ncbi:hypothetical protein FIU28_05215 [Tardiphaga sp. vice154]|uniref:hypothetical protein n=1 Tax=Tardiphaga sp. vice154 TaxID=2592814 RepID=UPI001161E31B|nr:hypothetical protein [Tardiphaga sp. vice154]QDM20596.1 hypothetical protein FIU28_05215 [Tardiphaga sp. vice154]
MNIKEAYSTFHYHYFLTVSPDGTEYRHCFSNWTIGNFEFAVWHEQRNDDLIQMKEYPEFMECRTTAAALAQKRSEKFRERVSPCTFQQVNVEKAEFAGSMMKEEYRSLRRWVLAQGLPQADFVITFHRDYYQLSFRAMNSTLEKVILFLKMNGVVSNRGSSDLIVEQDGRLEDLPGYKA